MQLNPLETFTVVRQIEDHSDPATYYVRAVVRNARTDAILATLDLISQGGQRFTKNWQVPSDVSGQGFYISIVTSVYTDSDYTAKSENYGDREQTFLVQARMNNTWGGMGGGGGADIDYVKIRKIIDEVVKNRLAKDIEIPNIPKIITTTKEVIAPIDFPEIPEMVDIKPLLALCEQILNILTTPEEEEDDRVDEILGKIESTKTELKKILQAGTSGISKAIADQNVIFTEKIESELSNVGGLLEESPIVRFPDRKGESRPEKPTGDRRINRLLTTI